jgi:hypothetical protein
VESIGKRVASALIIARKSRDGANPGPSRKRRSEGKKRCRKCPEGGEY